MTIRLTTISTRQGDAGEPRRGDGAPVPKSHLLIEAGGDVDELNAHLGALVAAGAVNPEVLRYLNRLSDLLFVLARTIGNPDGEMLWAPGTSQAA